MACEGPAPPPFAPTAPSAPGGPEDGRGAVSGVPTPPTTTVLQVALPNGARAGQQIVFTTPEGQQMMVAASEDIPPQGTMSVQVPRLPAPPPQPPQPPRVPVQADDEHAARQAWCLYALGWPVCLLCPLLATVAWAALACLFARGDAAVHRPRTRRVARVSKNTSACVCVLQILVLMLYFLGDVHPRHHLDYMNPVILHQPTAPVGDKADLILDGFGCKNGYGWENNQHYVYQGETRDGRPYYRGKAATDKYLYFDKQCDDEYVNRGAWIVGRHPDTNKHDHLAGETGVCIMEGMVFADDHSMPIGEQKWDWIWCGDHGRKDKRLSARIVDGADTDQDKLVRDAVDLVNASSASFTAGADNVTDAVVGTLVV